MTLFPTTCPTCGQKLTGVMFDRHFTPSRYRILNMIKLHPGLTREGLATRLYGNSREGTKRTVSSTITTINNILEGTGWKILLPGWSGKGYILTQEKDWNSMWEKPFDRPELLVDNKNNKQ